MADRVRVEPAFLITHQAAGFGGYGMGSYTFFDKGVPVFATNAFELADTPAVSCTTCSRFSSAPRGQAESPTW